jgi:hypothetical protein
MEQSAASNQGDQSFRLKKLDFLNSPELAALREAWSAEEARQETEDQAWWDSLTMEARAQAFRQVCKLLYKADVEHKGSYRYAVYDIFNVDYIDGMNHYMALHNLINKALSSSQEPQALDS